MLNLLLTLSLVVLASSQQGFNSQYTPAATPTIDSTPKSAESGSVGVMSNFIDATLVDMVWCGERKNVIFYLTEKNSLYRSADDGFTGNRITDHLQKIGKEEISGDSSEVGQVSRMVQSSVDKNLVVFLGTEGVNWITEDCGASFRALNQGRRIDDFQLHPTQRNWILASAWTLCEDFVSEPCKKYKELFISKDLGNTWELISDYVFQFSWAKFDKTFFTIPDQRIIIVHDLKGKGHQKAKGWNPKLRVSYSDDLFKTSVKIVDGGNRFLLTSTFFFVVQANGNSETVNLLVSNSRLTHYIMRPIDLPVKRLMEHSYTILDTSEHSVFLHINHDGENSRYGNIYKSDSTGLRYTTTLKGNVRSDDGQCDFQRVQGIEGIYLANVYDQDALRKYRNTGGTNFPVQHAGVKRTSEIAFSDPVGYSPERGMKTALFKADASKKTLNNYKKTMISFDKGGIWQPLSPPYKNRDGEKIVCASSAEEFCSLHLHSISSLNFGPFYTTENSVGLIIGTGNVGAYLSNKPDEINTYLSRDGGLTWFEIMKGSSIYEVGDHGSLIVLAPDQRATTEVFYSWNEGLTWQTLKISDVPIEISNIITEPSNTAEKFLIYGRASDQTSRGVIIAADFTPLLQRWCQGQDKPNTPESDYETWTPNGKISPSCLLGRQVSYIRRKREAECFSNEQQETWKYVKSCECTEEDWECDFGYTRYGSGPCLPLDEKETEKSHRPPEECKGYYYISQGYRKIGGDSCYDGVSHDPIRIPCPGLGAVNSENLSVIVMLSVAVGMLIWLNNKGNTERVKGRLGMFYRNVKKRIARLRTRGRDSEFHHIDRLPETLRDEEEDDFGGIVFEETEEVAEALEDAKIFSSVSKRMTEGKALDFAQTRVPILNKPTVIPDYFVVEEK